MEWLSSLDWELIKFCLVLEAAIKIIVLLILYICDVI